MCVPTIPPEQLAPSLTCSSSQIEYKLKLLPTSLHRMAKLRTQLKWRLIEGGGVAVYELGLLDDGTLVGLKQVDMEESLRTLGQMLAGLGGGRVQITRVVRLGGSARPASPASSDSSSTPSLSSSQSSAPSSATASMPPSHAPSPVPVLFPSFDVAADYDDLAFVALAAPPVIDPDTGDVSLFPPEPERGPVPYPRNRTAEEQAQLRRDKRDARRARREAAQAAATLAKAGGEESSLSPKPTSPIAIHPGNSSTISPRPRRTIHTEYPTPIKPRDKPPKPPKPPRRTAEARAEREIAKEKEQQQFVNGALETPFKPVLLKEGDEEVRFVVEAVVRKASRGDGRRGRRRSSHDDDFAMGLLNLDGDDDESSDVLASPDFDGSGDDSETVGDGDEGWSYLDFDLAQLSSSVKSSVATSSCK